jgi:hypothetical protein
MGSDESEQVLAVLKAIGTKELAKKAELGPIANAKLGARRRR